MNLHGVHMRFSDYLRIRCVFDTGLFTVGEAFIFSYNVEFSSVKRQNISLLPHTLHQPKITWITTAKRNKCSKTKYSLNHLPKNLKYKRHLCTP